MKKTGFKLLPLLLCGAMATTARGQSFTPITESYEYPDNEPAPCHPVPHPRQLEWNKTEFYAFFHYGMNTYTGKEWGTGNESESTFAPTKDPDTEQWLKVAQSAGMKGGIAVVKHHDGFCLWPTESTSHCVSSCSSTIAKNVNIPKTFAEAAQKLGMKYGFYVSPWDMSSASYGQSTYVTNVFLKQCTELAKYGDDQFEMWFDGANGGTGYYGGSYSTTRSVDASTYYDVPNLRDSIHNLCPNMVMWGVGEEARWIGNEEGYAGETNWAMMNRGKNEENQRNSGVENGWFWEPGESDAKATTNGWFWNSSQGERTPERLFQMYLETVGRNSTLILNLPPNKDGEIAAATVNTMQQLGELLKTRLGTDLARTATIKADKEREAGTNRNYLATNMIDGKSDTTYWATNDGETTATITLQWDSDQTLHYVMLQEEVAKGQRVKKFSIETSTDGSSWITRGGSIATTTIGYKRIIPLNGSTSASYSSAVTAKYVRIKILDSRACPLIHTISVY
jgi:alpha-L-fucosidase